MKKKTIGKEYIFTALILFVVLAVTMALDSQLPSYHIVIKVIKKASVYSLVAVSMNLLNGFTGLFSLGQAGFMLLGAYSYAVLCIPVAKRAGVYQYFDGGIVKFSLPEIFASFLGDKVGSAVGMANVWGFPNKLGSNGGGAFLLIYLLFVFIFSYVGLPAEFAMGRRAATGTLGAYENAWATRGRSAGKAGGLLGWLPLAGSMCIAIGYAVIVTYILKALADSLLGTLMTADAAAWFGVFSGTPYSVIPYHIVVVVGTLLTLFLGAHSIEKTNKVMMPLFFLIFLVLAVRVALLPNAAEGYLFMFTPRWEALTDPMIWIWAMGQAFFSLSVTGSGMIVYGAYLSKDEDVVDVAQHTALFDTIAAVVAALVIIPACFSYGLDVGAGPSLLFVTLPTILQDIPLGRMFAIILYVAMIFAGVSSLQNMFEAVAESLMHKFPRLSRTAVLVILCVVCLGFGIGMETIDKWGPWMDLVSIYIIPIGATLGAISWFYVMKKDELLDAVNTGSDKRIRIQMDAENYRAKREQSLESLAAKVAAKVAKYRRSVTLEPMNAYERHVIHAALQDVKGVTTYSVGTEPNRRVVVAYDREGK